jgi:TRAP-type C4-dicarboxylate transport system substrate-binding protein
MQQHKTFCALASSFCALASFCSFDAPARADKVVLRMATSAPDGTTWARELRAFAREVESATFGGVQVKWYWGGIAGDELQLRDRIRRGQIDGAASGGVLCQESSPAMRVVGIHGVFHSREETSFVLNRLRPRLEQDFHAAGFVYVGASNLGPDLLFTRAPIGAYDDFKKLKIWHWDLDQRGSLIDLEMGLHDVLLSLADLGPAMEDGRINAFITDPASLVAFQWTSLPRFVLNLPLGYSWGCLMIAERAFERIPLDQQQIIRAAGAAAGVRLDEVGRQLDDAMLGGLLQKLGIKLVPPNDALRAEFLSIARTARDHLSDKIVPAAVLQEVLALLADYRSEHAAR